MTQSSHGTESTWLGLSEAVDFLGVHFTTLRRWVDTGKVSCIRTPGGRRHFRPVELAEFLAGLQHGPGTASVPTAELRPPAGVSIQVGQLGVSDEP